MGLSYKEYAHVVGPARISNLEDIGFSRNKLLYLDIQVAKQEPVRLYKYYNYYGDVLEIHPEDGKKVV